MIQVVNDFDGVHTNQLKQAEMVKKVGIATLARLSGATKEYVSFQYNTIEQLIGQEPHRHGWILSDVITAYCDEDHFIRSSTILSKIVLENEDYKAAVEKRFTDTRKFIQHTFEEGCKQASPQIDLEKSKKVFNESKKGGSNTTIVTNSETKRIEGYLAGVGIKVYGMAKKYDIDPNFTNIGNSLEIEHLGKTYRVDLRRRKYFNILEEIKEQKGEVVAVVGDVFSLDLALPYALGMDIILKKNSYTPKWAEEFVKNCGRGHVTNDIAELPQIYETIKSKRGR